MGGKRTDIASLQKIFTKIYYAINIQNEGSKLSYIVDILKNLWFDFLLLICILNLFNEWTETVDFMILLL